MIDGPPDVKKNMDEIRREFQIGKEGISKDYFNEFAVAIKHCKTLLDKPGFSLASIFLTKVELKAMVIKKITSFRAYTEYMNSQQAAYGVVLADFLTPKGREIAQRLDDIAREIRMFAVEGRQTLDVAGILSLLEEGRALIYEDMKSN